MRKNTIRGLRRKVPGRTSVAISGRSKIFSLCLRIAGGELLETLSFWAHPMRMREESQPTRKAKTMDGLRFFTSLLKKSTLHWAAANWSVFSKQPCNHGGF
jgi:hypothetical protein